MSILRAGLPALSVHVHRVDAFENADLPAVVVYLTGERVAQQIERMQQPRPQRRDIDLQIVVFGAGEAGLDAIHGICETIERKIFADYSLGGLSINTRLTSVDIQATPGGDKTLHTVAMTWSVLVETREGDPDTTIV
ncbi:MAG: hypothetical protein ACT6Q8_24250 [Niveispirillum sp.]|uniref:hypothetical protein n=1 Tax=Niveispirillum sp. TaxID=1917217 RepID=UPI00403541DB